MRSARAMWKLIVLKRHASTCRWELLSQVAPREVQLCVKDDAACRLRSELAPSLKPSAFRLRMPSSWIETGCLQLRWLWVESLLLTWASMDEGSIHSELCTHSSQSFFFVQAKLLALSASVCHQVIAQDWSCFSFSWCILEVGERDDFWSQLVILLRDKVHCSAMSPYWCVEPRRDLEWLRSKGLSE